jgi:hypothetical protein
MTQLDKRRRQIFINWRLQGLLILFSVVILGCSMGYIYMATSRVMKILSDPSISQSMPPAGDEYYLFVAELRGYLDRIFLSVMGVALAVTIGGMMIFSNRIAGPAYRMTKFLNESPPENPGEVRLRKGDFFGELASAINSFLRKR